MKNILITGVSDTDPYTNISFEVLDENNKKIREINSNKAFIDGAMLNILRKNIKENEPINEIYIYLTKDMEVKKDIYIKAIKSLYSYYNLSIDLKNIKFYPNDFYEDYVDRLRKENVHKFASYYKEIYDIYSVIQQDKEEKNIILNISSGTPAFKADMMMMAVTNNLKIEQTANIMNEEIKNKIKEYCKEEFIDEKEKIEVKSIRNRIFPENNIEEIFNKLNITEDKLITRTQEESIDETKKVMVLESIEDSVAKKDYCGIYNTLVDNKKYLGDNKEQILLIVKNLYFRYIGNDKKANENIEDTKIQEYYPIYKFKNILNNVEEINSTIEKFNMMQIKSKRDEINDWLLISTPLLEAITSSLVTRKLGFNFEEILEDSKISLNKFNNNKIVPNRIKSRFGKQITDSNGQFLNAYFYKNIIFRMKDSEPNMVEKKKINKILDYIYIIDIARSDRVVAAHSIRNVDKETFTVEYERKLKAHSRYGRLKNIVQEYYNENNQFRSIECVEDAVKELIWELISNNNPLNKNIFLESINVYGRLENKILSLLKEDIYGGE